MAKKKPYKQTLIRSAHAKLLTGVLLLVVIAVGAVVAMALVREPQDNSSQAKFLNCDWCGQNCMPVDDRMMCPQVMHDDGICVNTEDGSGCEVIGEDEAKKRGIKTSDVPSQGTGITVQPTGIDVKTQSQGISNEGKEHTIDEVYTPPVSTGGNSLSAQNSLTADFDKDGDVDANDIKFLRSRFFQSTNDALRADLNGDRRVNFQDYAILRSQMGN